MKNKLIVMIILLTLLISCTKEKPFTETEVDGVKIIENSKAGINKDLSFKIDHIMTIENNEEDTTFVLNFPQHRADLNSDLDKDGNLYVVDNVKSFILKFDKTGKFVQKWGAKGQGPGEFPFNPIDINVVDSENKVYVFDGSGRLSIFDKDGNFDKFYNILSRGVRAKNLYMTNYGPLFVCEAFEGQWGSSEFKMGVCLYNSSPEFEVKDKIYGELKPFDMKNVDADDQGVLTAISGKYIYVADGSKNNYIIYQYDYEGKKIREIRKKYAPLRRSKEDIEEINEALKKVSQSMGGMIEFKDVSPLRSVMTQMFVDSKDNLWVGVNESMFNEEGQDFDIFNKEGHFLKTVTVPEFGGYKLRSKDKYVIAGTPIQQNYSEGGKADVTIKVFELSVH
ncbi:MAG: 6-bladed beta-propeller [Candidatus Delongbacteria bacterium]|nr:6-bladed beta-propeller [Candidatus Delongbacteria bacterium]